MKQVCRREEDEIIIRNMIRRLSCVSTNVFIQFKCYNGINTLTNITLTAVIRSEDHNYPRKLQLGVKYQDKRPLVTLNCNENKKITPFYNVVVLSILILHYNMYYFAL